MKDARRRRGVRFVSCREQLAGRKLRAKLKGLRARARLPVRRSGQGFVRPEDVKMGFALSTSSRQGSLSCQQMLLLAARNAAGWARPALQSWLQCLPVPVCGLLYSSSEALRDRLIKKRRGVFCAMHCLGCLYKVESRNAKGCLGLKAISDFGCCCYFVFRPRERLGRP